MRHLAYKESLSIRHKHQDLLEKLYLFFIGFNRLSRADQIQSNLLSDLKAHKPRHSPLSLSMSFEFGPMNSVSWIWSRSVDNATLFDWRSGREAQKAATSILFYGWINWKAIAPFIKTIKSSLSITQFGSHQILHRNFKSKRLNQNF